MNKNFLLGIITTIVVYFLSEKFAPEFMSGFPDIVKFMVFFLLSYPWKIGKNIYSIWGGFNPEGSVYSLFPIVQYAEKNSFGMMGIAFYQRAEADATQGLGLALYQGAGNNAVQGLGLALYQRAGNDAWQGLGLALYQRAGKDSLQVFGLALYQRAEEVAGQGFGLRFLIQAKEVKSETFACITVFEKKMKVAA